MTHTIETRKVNSIRPSRAAAARGPGRRVHADPFDTYLEALRGMPEPLDREAEVRAAQRLEEAERVCLRSILEAGVALPELPRWAERFEQGEMSIPAIAHLGLYDADRDGDERDGERSEQQRGRAQLSARLAKAAAAERSSARNRPRSNRPRSNRATSNRATSNRATSNTAAVKAPGQRTEGARTHREARWERALERRARAVEAIGLNRDRVQEIVDRVARNVRALTATDEAERRGAAEALGGGVDTRALARRLNADRRRIEACRNALAMPNLRLVVMLSKRHRRSAVPFADLVQEGNLGLMRAVDKFDHRVGTRLSTYASWWVQQAVAREASRQSETVRVPFGMIERRRRVVRTVRRLTQALGREPDPGEVADEVGEPLDRVRSSLEAQTHSVPLHAPAGAPGEGDRALAELLSPEDELGADEEVAWMQRWDAARASLRELSDREQHILRRRFGLSGDGEELTLREIGLELGLSRERIRQLESVALDKLRAKLDGAR